MLSETHFVSAISFGFLRSQRLIVGFLSVLLVIFGFSVII